MTTLEGIRNAEITELEMRMQSRLLGIVHELRLFVQGQCLILRGHSRTYYGKQLAQQAVMEAALLPILANEIEVI